MSLYLIALLAIAIAPGIAIAIYIWWRDKYEREPPITVAISSILGMFAIVPAIMLELTGEKIFGKMNGANLFSAGFHAFFIVGFSEEVCKLAALMIYAYRSREFNERIDGIVYAVMVSMGFATLENVFYAIDGGISTALMRMFLSVPAHATFGVIMGFFVGYGKENIVNAQSSKEKQAGVLTIFVGLFFASLFHGAYDFFLFIESIPLLAFGAVASLIVGIKLSLMAINHLSESSSDGRQWQ
ncbi:PrsW family glutamic-type intramembrane protease [Ignavibacteria bacterium]|nr:PrsW family intramembrane metalloprotease [Bacteroidota bacterium]MCZ2132778.1 PrsW family intramembrane metalloprotease [Bacteroidota bacterium]